MGIRSLLGITDCHAPSVLAMTEEGRSRSINRDLGIEKEEIIWQGNRYASYVRWQRERGEEALPRHEWELYVDVRDEDADA